jgi:hypothetical protein
MIRTIWRALLQRAQAPAGAPPTFMSTETPLLEGHAIKTPGVYWYFGPDNKLPALVEVHNREGRMLVVFRDQAGFHNPAKMPGYFDGPIPHLPPPSTIAGDL